MIFFGKPVPTFPDHALEIPFIAKDQRRPREFVSVAVRLLTDVTAVTQQLASQAAQLRGHDRAMNDLECDGEPGEHSRKRPSTCIGRVVPVVLADVTDMK